MKTMHKSYVCRVCGKEDRKGRMIGHVLKYHVPLDKIPYSCSLCNFRCTDKVTLWNHVNQYQRHKDEAMRAGDVALKSVLHRSDNPANVEDYVRAKDQEALEPEGTVDPSIFENQESEEPLLPDWLQDVARTPKSTLKRFRVNSGTKRSTPSQITLPATTTTPINTFVQPGFPRLVSPAAVSDGNAPFAASLPTQAQTYVTAAQALPFTTTLPLNLPPVLTIPTVFPAVGNTAPTPQGTISPKMPATASLSTPLQDEHEYYIADLLDHNYQDDPLFKEMTVASKESTTQTDKNSPVKNQQEDLLRRILQAIETNGKEMHTLNRNMRSLIDENRNLHQAFGSLERTLARRQVPITETNVRSRSPLFSQGRRRDRDESPSKTLKSVVKKAKKNPN